MKKFFKLLLSDSNKISAKRFIGLICLIMFIAYGIRGMFVEFNVQFWIFYVSLSAITVWIAFRFMSAEKALKYNIIEQLSRFANMNSTEQAVNKFKDIEDQVDSSIIQKPPVEQTPPE